LQVPCLICGQSGVTAPLCYSSYSPLTGRLPGHPPVSQLWRCGHCHALFRIDLPGIDRVWTTEEWFDQVYYVAPANEETYRGHKEGMFRDLQHRMTAAFGRPGKLIDFGCSYGHLAATFREAGWKATGVDVAPSIIEMHRRSGKLEVFPSLDDPGIPDGQADVIAMIDVLCYVDQPLDLLRLAYRKLASPGVILLRVPNRNRFMIRGARRQDLPTRDVLCRYEVDHRTYWCARTIQVVSKLAGFDHVVIRRREKGYRYPTARRKALHYITQAVSAATAGVIDFATVFHAELWKGSIGQQLRR